MFRKFVVILHHDFGKYEETTFYYTLSDAVGGMRETEGEHGRADRGG